MKAESSDQKDEDGMTHGKNWKRDRQPKGGQQEKEERKERKEGDEKMRKLKRKVCMKHFKHQEFCDSKKEGGCLTVDKVALTHSQ